ncbi:thioredoxin family protein [Aminomonas paucivorans]|uniref:thioredoxin family protein n=1 Tax=Aminomonas paucivorans TaxID=81412 RepID=UPI00332CA047
MVELNKEIYEAEVLQADLPVVVDFWGPSCGPCLALMPEVIKLGESYEGRVKFCKLNAAENRRLCATLKVMGLPTILFYKGGELVDRITGAEVSLEAIRERAEKLLA